MSVNFLWNHSSPTRGAETAAPAQSRRRKKSTFSKEEEGKLHGERHRHPEEEEEDNSTTKTEEENLCVFHLTWSWCCFAPSFFGVVLLSSRDGAVLSLSTRRSFLFLCGVLSMCLSCSQQEPTSVAFDLAVKRKRMRRISKNQDIALNKLKEHAETSNT